MPGRNINKVYTETTFYHVYNRGVNKQLIFLDEQDYTVFLGLLKRYLDPSYKGTKANRTPYPCYNDKVNLVAYCLMPNHFHLFIYQISADGMKLLLRSVSVAYGMYFNKKYKRIGPVFQQRYRAVAIRTDEQLLHITRYIHLNPIDYRAWKWSSLPNYVDSKYSRWVSTYRVLELFENDPVRYLSFVDEYKDKREELALLKEELAG